MKLGRQTRRLNYIMMLVIFFLQTIDNYLRNKRLSTGGINSLKNLLLLMVGFILFYEIHVMKRKKVEYKRIFYEEAKYIILLVISYFLLSVYYMIVNHGVEWITFKGLFKMLMPVVIAYSILNLFKLNDIYKLMSASLIMTFTGYLFFIADRISISNILSINFALSRSPFESTYFSPTAMGFCLFFCYYREKKSLTVLSVFFAVMTFKRIMVLYSIFLLLFGGMFRRWRKVPQILIRIFMVSFTVISCVYYLLMAGYIEDFIRKYFHMDVNQFSMGRSYFLKRLLVDFTSHGFMTSNLNSGGIEMDIPMIYVEMGFGAVIATIYFITKLAKNNWYNFMIVIFCLFELLTSHWLDISYFWIVAYVTIGCITYKEEACQHIVKNSSEVKVVNMKTERIIVQDYE